MKVYAAVMTGMFLSVIVLLFLLQKTDCSLGNLFLAVAVTYATGISATMFINEKEEKNNND